jgi:hypothetical protein
MRESLLVALSGQSARTYVCPLSDNSGQPVDLGRDGLSAKTQSGRQPHDYTFPMSCLAARSAANM